MPILKQQASQPLIRDAVVLDLGDLGRQAARLRAAAQAKAEQILTEARDEAQRIIAAAEQQGYDAGHAKGLAEGTEQGRQQGHAEALAAGAELVQQTTQQFDAVAREWDTHRTQLDRDARTDVLRFALKFAEQVTHRVLETDPSVIADQVSAALSRVLEPTNVAIYVHPEDSAALRDVLPDLLAGLSHLQHVEVTEDASVGRGGCRLGIAGGEVDASIDTQIRRLAEAILPDAELAEEPVEVLDDSAEPDNAPPTTDAQALPPEPTPDLPPAADA
ncbi:MAG: FliH/SctL family protein [Planctomycetota bacterium]